MKETTKEQRRNASLLEAYKRELKRAQQIDNKERVALIEKEIAALDGTPKKVKAEK